MVGTGIRKSYREFIAFQYRNLTQTLKPLPDGIGMQPMHKSDRTRSKWQRKQRICSLDGEWGARELFVEDVPPEVMPESWPLIIVGPHDFFHGGFPLGCWFPGCGGIVYSPDQHS